MAAPKGNKYLVGNPGGIAKYTPEIIEQLAQDMIDWFEASPRNIWLNKFCIEHDLDDQRISDFEKKNEVFKVALAKAKKKQEAKLVEFGLFGDTNPGFTKFVLENNHKWKTTVNVQADQKTKDMLKAAEDNA